MREILFRGKHIYTGRWIEGSYVHRTKFCGDTDDAHFILSGGGFDCGEYGAAFTVDPETVGQYTGLEDRNGRKIFEGDIVAHVEFPDEPTLICWHKSGFAIKGLWYESDILRYIKHIEVVGNIHDNPDMIDGGQQ